MCAALGFESTAPIEIDSSLVCFNRAIATVLQTARPLKNVRPEPPSICLPVKNEQIPPGSILNCSCFTTIEGKERDVRPCAAIAEDTFITIEQLMKWNPWVGSDCDKSVYAGLDDGQDRAVCIGVKSNSTSTN